MELKKRTLKELFDEPMAQFIIPEYQRAYEWDTKEERKRNQVKEFWEDLNEFLKSQVEFPLGNIIVLRNGYKYTIIDGQQRITTSIILLKSIAERLKKDKNLKLANKITERYLIFTDNNYSVIKFKPQQYDENFWIDYIVNDKEREPETPSQKRIKDAKEFFDKELEKLTLEQVLRIMEKLENAQLVVIELQEEKNASSIFILHNDRGKTLSNLDKLKAFFMHQIMVNNGSNDDVRYVYREFEGIYKILNSFRFRVNEDDVLSYHIYAEYGYYKDINDVRRKIKNLPFNEVVPYIKDFSRGLYESFKALEKFQNDNHEIACYLKDLRHFRFAFAYPFIIKAYKLYDNKRKEDLLKFLQYMEKIVFIHNLTGTRASIRDRLNEFLTNISDSMDIDEFFMGIFRKLSAENYWAESSIKQALDGHMYKDLAKYILKRYEIYLRKEHPEGYPEDLICNYDIYKGDERKRTGWWLEHIAPQTENPEQDSGYDKYDKEFIENYLNSIGNLLLVSESHNLALGNRSFYEKVKSYNKSPMFHHREVEKFAKDGKWLRDSIRERRDKIKEFVLKTWGFTKIS